MTDNNEIIIDASSCFSADEQREILSQINGIAEKNRQKLSENAPKEKSVLNAKKKSGFFPLAVNIAAIAVLCAGAALLVSFNTKADAEVRTGNAVYNLTERALIEEIRKDTSEQIAAKEKEIGAITSRMEEIDNELLQLYSSNINLSSDQIEARERLLAMQGTFREELSVLNEERSQILESSRAREARLRAQLEERTREFAAAQQKVSGELETALNELERLSGEQEKIAAVDANFSGGIASIGDMIQNSRYDQASQFILNLRDFIGSPSISNTRSFRSRREYYNQALNLMEVMIADSRKNSSSGSGAEQIELMTKNSQLQDTISEMQRTIDSFSSGSSGQTRRISELEALIASLQNTNTALEQRSAEKDRTISTLQNENANLTSNNTELRAANTSQTQRIADLNNQLTAIRQLLTENQ